MAEIALETTYSRHDNGKYKGFNKASPDIHHAYGRLYTVKIGATVCTEEENTVRYPPMIPMRSKKAVSNGKLMIEAATLGLTRYRMGSTPMEYKASICSEVRRIPISAAMPEPARAAIMIAVRTGPISLTRERDTAEPEGPYGTKLHQGIESCNPSTIPVKRLTNITIRDDLAPI